MKVTVNKTPNSRNTAACHFCGRRSASLPHIAVLIQKEIVLISNRKFVA